jgi:hypothetical protein
VMAITCPPDSLVRRHHPATVRRQMALYQHEVEDMMATAASFDEIEDAIDDAPITVDRKAALWLLAWSLRDPSTQRQQARNTLALLESHR